MREACWGRLLSVAAVVVVAAAADLVNPWFGRLSFAAEYVAAQIVVVAAAAVVVVVDLMILNVKR